MSAVRATALLLAALLCACGASPELPVPAILSVTPNRLTVPKETPASERKLVRISLDAVFGVHVDYGREEVRADAARVWLGSEEAAVQSLEQDGTVIVSVPEALDEGTYDVRVVLSDGREAVRTSALTLVVPGSTRVTDGGQEPGNLPGGDPDAGVVTLEDGGTHPDSPMRHGDVTGFEIEPVAQQASGVPFLVTVRAMGPRGAHFRGGVELTLNKHGTVSPYKLGPFDSGVCVQPVTVYARGGNVKLTVTDAFGAQGTTNGFKVK